MAAAGDAWTAAVATAAVATGAVAHTFGWIAAVAAAGVAWIAAVAAAGPGLRAAVAATAEPRVCLRENKDRCYVRRSFEIHEELCHGVRTGAKRLRY